ncbi:systemin receptor SR160-like [Ipomoea triloba]|uniref:systemin receptor SR160-like n=1 Tax=Ipomoea triloba TaxID=35885 RepID=UPI00125DA35B|nr:systemin receptor SR160-like [Ipomoea triloba]
MNLAQWAHKHQREGKSAADVLDEEIKEPRYLEAMITVFKLGLACTLSSPSSRPSMKDISQILQRCSVNNHIGSLASASKSQCAASLRYIYLAENSISEPVYDINSLGRRCYNLKALNLSSNSMDPPGREVAEGGATIRLRSLDLSYNNISGQNTFVMLSPSYFPDLELLSLKGNKLSGKIWELSFRNLLYLDLSANNFSEKFPSFQDCSSLQHLDLSSNNFSGNIVASLSSRSNLNLSNNKLSGELRVETGDDERGILLCLKQQYWGNPSSLEQWNSTSSPCDWPYISCNFNGSVTRIYLYDKGLKGSFPSKIICQLNSLSSIYLSTNYLWGTIPVGLSSCSMLEELDLSANNFTGKIPGELFYMKTLLTLRIGENMLSGEIPTPIAAYSLEYLDLSSNHLNGSIPDDMI